MASNAAPLSLRRTLRHETSEEHRALDGLVESRRGEDGLIDLANWGQVLRALEASHRTVERMLDKHDVGDAGHLPKADLAAADLATMGLCPVSPPVFGSAGCGGTVAGLLYVVEGSMLGARALDELVTPAAPRSFLRAYGDHVGDRWRRTVAWIDTQGSLERSVPAAKAAFAMFFDMMDRCLRPPSPVVAPR